MCEKHLPATFVRIAEDELCDAGAQMEAATLLEKKNGGEKDAEIERTK